MTLNSKHETEKTTQKPKKQKHEKPIQRKKEDLVLPKEQVENTVLNTS